MLSFSFQRVLCASLLAVCYVSAKPALPTVVVNTAENCTTEQVTGTTVVAGSTPATRFPVTSVSVISVPTSSASGTSVTSASVISISTSSASGTSAPATSASAVSLPGTTVSAISVTVSSIPATSALGLTTSNATSALGLMTSNATSALGLTTINVTLPSGTYLSTLTKESCGTTSTTSLGIAASVESTNYNLLSSIETIPQSSSSGVSVTSFLSGPASRFSILSAPIVNTAVGPGLSSAILTPASTPEFASATIPEIEQLTSTWLSTIIFTLTPASSTPTSRIVVKSTLVIVPVATPMKSTPSVADAASSFSLGQALSTMTTTLTLQKTVTITEAAPGSATNIGLHTVPPKVSADNSDMSSAVSTEAKTDRSSIVPQGFPKTSNVTNGVIPPVFTYSILPPGQGGIRGANATTRSGTYPVATVVSAAPTAPTNASMSISAFMPMKTVSSGSAGSTLTVTLAGLVLAALMALTLS